MRLMYMSGHRFHPYLPPPLGVAPDDPATDEEDEYAEDEYAEDEYAEDDYPERQSVEQASPCMDCVPWVFVERDLDYFHSLYGPDPPETWYGGYLPDDPEDENYVPSEDPDGSTDDGSHHDDDSSDDSGSGNTDADEDHEKEPKSGDENPDKNEDQESACGEEEGENGEEPHENPQRNTRTSPGDLDFDSDYNADSETENADGIHTDSENSFLLCPAHTMHAHENEVESDTKAFEQEEQFQRRASVSIPLSDNLKSLIVDDWERVSKNCTVVALPAPRPVRQIFNEYTEEEKSKRAGNRLDLDILHEITSGLSEYFDTMLEKILLFRYERPQYYLLRKRYLNVDDHGPVAVYGAEHLLRMISTFFFPSSHLCIPCPCPNE